MGSTGTKYFICNSRYHYDDAGDVWQKLIDERGTDNRGITVIYIYNLYFIPKKSFLRN